MNKDDYKYYKFVGGKYFRTTNEEDFEVVNDDMWEEDDMVYFVFNDLGIDHVLITDPEELERLKSLPSKEKGVTK